MSLFRHKAIADLQAEAQSGHGLKRVLGPLNLTMLGIGAIIGTGIFVLTGTVAAQNDLVLGSGDRVVWVRGVVSEPHWAADTRCGLGSRWYSGDSG